MTPEQQKRKTVNWKLDLRTSKNYGSDAVLVYISFIESVLKRALVTTFYIKITDFTDKNFRLETFSKGKELELRNRNTSTD